MKYIGDNSQFVVVRHHSLFIHKTPLIFNAFLLALNLKGENNFNCKNITCKGKQLKWNIHINVSAISEVSSYIYLYI